MAVIPTGTDGFTLGRCTAGWQVRDPFRDATHLRRDPSEAVSELAALDAYGVTLGDGPVGHLLGSR